MSEVWYEMIVRRCDICGVELGIYTKLNAKQYGGGKETVHKPAIFKLELCDKCFDKVTQEILEDKFKKFMTKAGKKE